MLSVILSLAIPPIGQSLHGFFIEFLGPNIVNGATGIAITIMQWGSTGFLPAFTIFIVDGIVFLVLGVLFTRFVWAKRPGWMGNTPKPVTTAPLQSQLNTPDLYVPKQQTPPPPAPIPTPQTKPEEKTA